MHPAIRTLAAMGGALASFVAVAADAPCSPAWNRSVEAQFPTSDGKGHGPDVGSSEWRMVIERHLGLRGKAGLPARDSQAWCERVDETLRARGPAFKCVNLKSSIEEMICKDPALAAYDRRMAVVYRDALKRAANERPAVLKPEQRGWALGRNDCWKADDKRACTEESYVRRIAELQARYRLLPAKGPVRFACDGDPRNEVVANYFDTEPPTLIAERGDQVSLMYLKPAASGTSYVGRNESLREHQGEVVIVWGWQAPEMRCKRAS